MCSTVSSILALVSPLLKNVDRRRSPQLRLGAKSFPAQYIGGKHSVIGMVPDSITLRGTLLTHNFDTFGVRDELMWPMEAKAAGSKHPKLAKVCDSIVGVDINSRHAHSTRPPQSIRIGLVTLMRVGSRLGYVFIKPGCGQYQSRLLHPVGKHLR